MNRRAAITLTVLLTCAALAWGQTANQVRVLETGTFHGNEISARTGERWLALFVNEKESQLRPVTLRVAAAFDEIVDAGTRQKTGKAVSINLPGKPLLLISNAPLLKASQVTTIFLANHEQPHALAERPETPLTLGATTYILRVTGGAKEASGALPRDAQLSLTDGKLTQTLYQLNGTPGDAGWELLWAGDLDGDGKLDLYVDASYHMNIAERRLFLSSAAKPGQLVAEVGKFTTTGC